MSDWISTGTLPSGGHRMSDPSVRLRTLLAAGAVVLATWGAMAGLTRSRCPGFSERETRDLAGLPIAPACIQDRLPPSTDLLPGAKP